MVDTAAWDIMGVVIDSVDHLFQIPAQLGDPKHHSLLSYIFFV